VYPSTSHWTPGRACLLLGLFLLALFLLGSTGGAGEPTQTPRWHDNLTTRLEALALLETLNADLLSHDSATKTLERWCDVHHLASPATVVAERMSEVDKPISDEQRRILEVGPTEPVRYRRVWLHCGVHVLSQADNWYVPGRLASDMNRQLESTDRAFGRVIEPLHFRRETLSATLLWQPLPPGWEMGAGIPSEGVRLEFPQELLRHRAVLRTPEGKPLSLVVETYTSAIFAFPEPAPSSEHAGS
jgi:chorismate-pyruvate lyase